MAREGLRDVRGVESREPACREDALGCEDALCCKGPTSKAHRKEKLKFKATTVPMLQTLNLRVYETLNSAAPTHRAAISNTIHVSRCIVYHESYKFNTIYVRESRNKICGNFNNIAKGPCKDLLAFQFIFLLCGIEVQISKVLCMACHDVCSAAVSVYFSDACFLFFVNNIDLICFPWCGPCGQPLRIGQKIIFSSILHIFTKICILYSYMDCLR